MLHKFYHSLAIDKLTENEGDYIRPYSKCNKRLMDTLFFISLSSYPICLKLYMLTSKHFVIHVKFHSNTLSKIPVYLTDEYMPSAIMLLKVGERKKDNTWSYWGIFTVELLHTVYTNISFKRTGNIRLKQLQFTQFQTHAVLKEKNRKKTLFFKSAEFVLAGMKAQWDESSGRILLGDNKDGEAVMLWPIRVQGAGVSILTGLPFIYTYSWPYV
jgi:hypothetical protein